LGLLGKGIKSSSSIVIDGAHEEEVLLCLVLIMMAELVDLIPLGDVVVNFNPKMMRTNPKLPKRDSKSMLLVSKPVGGCAIRPFLNSKKCIA
jgi:hypothetical protein